MKKTNLTKALLLLCCLCMGRPAANAYALLSHEALIDDAWEGQLRPLLLKKYPGTTEEELTEAHAYLYGGAIMPDIGYFPMGSAMFSDLVHYVRTGDFVHNLLLEAKDVKEFAFALGFLCHYSADCTGHPSSTNQVVPKLFPCAMRKYGDTVTYEQAKKYHTRTEFSFDVFMVSSGEYEPKTYQNFIGFKISEPLLERAFLRTYGLELKDVFKRFGMAESVFRFSVRNLMPAITKACWRWKKRQLEDAAKLPKPYRVDKKAYNKDYGKPGIRSMGLAFLVVALPKVGPLSVLRFKVPDDEVQRIFKQSYDSVLKVYQGNINKVASGHADALPNLNFDTGRPTAAGEYEMADATYLCLLKTLRRKGFDKMDAGLRRNLLDFYGEKQQLVCPKAGSRKARLLERDLGELKKAEVAKEAAMK